MASDNRGMLGERTVKSCYMSRMIKEERMGVYTTDFRVKPHMMFVTCTVDLLIMYNVGGGYFPIKGTRVMKKNIQGRFFC